MTDTPQPVKDLQLRIWLSQTPAERLRRLMMDNDAIFNFRAVIKPIVKTTTAFPDKKNNIFFC
jgi:hypothetical protein